MTEKILIEYIKAYCPVDHYNCLMPIEYECMEEDDHPGRKKYRKVRCNCHNVRAGACDQSTACKHFTDAPEMIER